jgi:hypothetical protein
LSNAFYVKTKARGVICQTGVEAQVVAEVSATCQFDDNEGADDLQHVMTEGWQCGMNVQNKGTRRAANDAFMTTTWLRAKPLRLISFCPARFDDRAYQVWPQAH